MSIEPVATVATAAEQAVAATTLALRHVDPREGQTRWKQPPARVISSSGQSETRASSPADKNLGCEAWPPDLVQLRPTPPVGAFVPFLSLLLPQKSQGGDGRHVDTYKY